MKFRIYRASQFSADKSAPCDDAFQHENKWHVEIADLDALMRFSAREASGLIVGPGQEIWIYDGYME